MPYGDHTGPEGLGARTGRGFGYCNGAGMPGYANPIGRGFGRGRGFGFGCGRGFGRGRGFVLGRGYGRGFGRWYMPYNPPVEFSKEDEIAALKAEKEALENELKALQKRIDDLAQE